MVEDGVFPRIRLSYGFHRRLDAKDTQREEGYAEVGGDDT